MQQVGPGAFFVDGKVIDHRLHRERQGIFKLALGLRHKLLQPRLARGFLRGVKDESHAAARHAAQHPEPEKILPELRLHPVDDGFREQIRGPGNDGLDGAEEISRRRRAQGCDVLTRGVRRGFHPKWRAC